MSTFARVMAWGACAAVIGYGLPQVLQVLHLLPDPIDRILIFAPSLALATLFVLALAALAAEASAEEREWRFAALALGCFMRRSSARSMSSSSAS